MMVPSKPTINIYLGSDAGSIDDEFCVLPTTTNNYSDVSLTNKLYDLLNSVSLEKNITLLKNKLITYLTQEDSDTVEEVYQILMIFYTYFIHYLIFSFIAATRIKCCILIYFSFLNRYILIEI